MKGDYRPPKDFTTMNKVQYPAYDISFTEEKSKGTQAMQNGQRKSHKSQPKYFVGHSSYALQFQNHGSLPKANIKDRSPLKSKKEIFDATTTYANQCKTSMDDNLATKGKEMRERTK